MNQWNWSSWASCLPFVGNAPRSHSGCRCISVLQLCPGGRLEMAITDNCVVFYTLLLLVVLHYLYVCESSLWQHPKQQASSALYSNHRALRTSNETVYTAIAVVSRHLLDNNRIPCFRWVLVRGHVSWPCTPVLFHLWALILNIYFCLGEKRRSSQAKRMFMAACISRVRAPSLWPLRLFIRELRCEQPHTTCHVAQVFVPNRRVPA